MPHQDVHVVRAREPIRLRDPLRQREHAGQHDQRRSRHERQDPDQRERPREVPRQEHRAQQREGQQRPSPPTEQLRHRTSKRPREPRTGRARSPRRATPARTRRATPPSVSALIASSSAGRIATAPATLVRRELAHPERRVVELEERARRARPVPLPARRAGARRAPAVSRTRAITQTTNKRSGRNALASISPPTVRSPTAQSVRSRSANHAAPATASATSRSLWPLAAESNSTTGLAPNATTANAACSGRTAPATSCDHERRGQARRDRDQSECIDQDVQPRGRRVTSPARWENNGPYTDGVSTHLARPARWSGSSGSRPASARTGCRRASTRSVRARCSCTRPGTSTVGAAPGPGGTRTEARGPGVSGPRPAHGRPAEGGGTPPRRRPRRTPRRSGIADPSRPARSPGDP